MNYQLIIDTSSAYSMVALTQGDQLIESCTELHANQLSCSLLPTIVMLTERAKISLSELSQIAVGVGPGSYTGTRVGVAVAKGLSFGLKIPLRTFCSLLTHLSSFCGTFACVMPSKTGGFFLLKGSQSTAHLEISFSSLVSPLDLELQLNNIAHIFQKPQELPPCLRAPVLYLHCSQSLPIPQQVDLIYLHQP